MRDTPVTAEERTAHIIMRINDFVSDYIGIRHECEVFENKPMTLKDRNISDSTICGYRDSIEIERHTMQLAFGEDICTALDDAFEKLFDAGEHQGKIISARQLKAMNVMTTGQIAEATGLTAEEIEGL